MISRARKRASRIKRATKKVTNALLLTCLSMGLGIAAPSYADETLSDAMLTTFNHLITIFEPEDTSLDQQRAEVAKVVDFESITRGVLKDHLSQISDEQKLAFRTEFERSITNLLGTALKSAKEFDVSIERVQKSNRNPNRARVLGVLTSPKNERFELVTTVAYKEEQWVVRNLIVNGINLGVTYRNQFNELVERNAGDIDATIAAWAAAVDQTAV